MSLPRVGRVDKLKFESGRNERKPQHSGPISKNPTFDERMEEIQTRRSFGEGSYDEELKSFNRFKNGRQSFSVGTTS